MIQEIAFMRQREHGTEMVIQIKVTIQSCRNDWTRK